ncbi:MAG: AAA family ATPase, partial [Ilumatobacteraceae bacterium]
MRSTYCPVMVGRDAERATIEQRLTEAAQGSGGVVLITGEAGIGKTRLGEEARSIASTLDIRTATGRAATGASVPFRPLAEALLHAFRATGLPDDRSLDAFRAHLGRLVPEWSADATTEPSPLLIGEAIVRLLRAADHGSGWMLVLEDMQWADADTLTVIDFLADTLRTEDVLCVLTMRAEGPVAADLLSRLRSRRVETIELGRLSSDEVGAMVNACLDGSAVPAPLEAFIRFQAEGAPLVVEEVLAGLVAAGQLINDGSGWQLTSALEPRSTSSIAESVEQRLQPMTPAARSMLAAAAVMGRRFDWELLGAITELDEATVNESLRAGVTQQLIVVEGGGFTFRHALIRQSVLERLLPPERVGLAKRALIAVDAAHPELEADWCELAASLAIDAGDRTRAAELLAESARRAAARGAFSSAEQALERAREIAPAGVRPWVERRLMGVWLHVGRPAMVLELGEAQLASGGDLALPPHDRLTVLADMAAAALAVGEVARSARLAADALDVARTDAGEAAIGRAEVTAARAAVAGGHTADAARLAASAIDRAVSTGRADLESEGLQLLAAATDEFVERKALLERAIAVARNAGLTSLALGAQFELASMDGLVDNGARLRVVRDEAARTGAVVTAASADLIAADFACFALDHDRCLDAAQRCVEASRRFGLAMLPVAQLWLAGAHAIGDRGDEMEAVLAEAAEFSD